MTDQQEKVPKAASAIEKWTLILAVIGVPAAVLAVFAYFGFQPEKRKSLEWEYVAKASLVNSAAGPVEKVKILFDGKEMGQVTILTGRLVNIGDLPISENQKDTERLEFDQAKAKIIGATITGRVNAKGNALPESESDCGMDGNALVIHHGLLNPGDTITIQAVFDGDPGEIGPDSLPPIKAHIAGITEPLTKYVSVRAPVSRVTIFPLTRQIEYFLLSILSLTILVIFGGTFGLIYTALKQGFPSKSVVEQAVASALSDKGSIDSNIVLFTNSELRSLLALCDYVIDPKYFDETSSIRLALSNPSHSQTLSGLGLTPEQAAQKMNQLLRTALPQSVARSLYFKLKTGHDKLAKSAVEKLPMNDSESYEAFIKRAGDIAISAVMPHNFTERYRLIDKSDIGAGALILFLTLSMAIVLTGSWNLLLHST